MSATFDALFHKQASRVRRVLLLRRAVAGLGVGLAAGGLAAGVAWYLREGTLRFVAAGAVAAVGVALGLWAARRRRLSDGDVALYLDKRLESEEAITTAFEVGRDEGADPEVKEALHDRATAALEKADPKAVRPRFFAWQHLAAPLGAGLVALFAFMPMPPAPPVPPPPPGSELVKEGDVPELERLENLSSMPARDEAQRARLDKIASDAKKLREKIKNGAPRREVLAEMSKLDDSLAAEKLSLGEGEERKGLEGAMAKLAEEPSLDKAQKALGDRDLVEFDKEMQRLANSLEKKDRDRAKKTLEEAADIAKKEGAKDVAKMLEEEKKRLEDQEKKSEAMKNLADSIKNSGSDQAKKDVQAAQDQAKSGDPEAQKKLADALSKAVSEMSPEEQKQLAENLKSQIEQAKKDAEKSGTEPPDTKNLEELAKKLDTPEGREQLKKELEQMAKEQPKQGSEAERQQKLEQAQQDLDAAKDRMSGGAPSSASGAPSAGKPGQGPGQPKPGKDGQPGQPGLGPNGKTPPGSPDPGGQGGDSSPGKNGKGPGNPTSKIDAKDFRSRADSDINGGAPMPGVHMGRTNARPGETANTQGAGALGAVGPDEVNGVSRSDVPEEYREQVGRYFQP